MTEDIFSYINSSTDQNKNSGLLSGKNISVQPNMSVRGWPAGAGSPALENYAAIEDAAVVERIKSSGGKIKASTFMSELGLGLRGDTSGIALKGKHVDIALVTDSIGESRILASSVNACGFKPSYGIVPRCGLSGLIPSMECFGIMAEKIEDINSVMKVIAGPDERDLSMPETKTPGFSTGLKKKQTGVSAGVIKETVDSLDPDEKKMFDESLLKLKTKNVKIEQVNLADFGLAGLIHNIIGSVEASSSCGKYDSVRYGHRTASSKDWNELYLKSRAESFGLLIKTYIFQGAYFQFEDYPSFENACRIRGRIIKNILELFKRFDVIVLPSSRLKNDAFKAETIREMYRVFSMTLLANLTGVPAVTIPGLQVISPWLSDAGLLELAYSLTDSDGG